jgi:hypothetical protein
LKEKKNNLEKRSKYTTNLLILLLWAEAISFFFFDTLKSSE